MWWHDWEVLDHILYDQDVLDELETDFLELSSEGFGETRSVSSRVITFQSLGTDRKTVEHDGWRLELTCRPEMLYDRLCEHLRHWGQAHDAGTLRVLKHVRAESSDSARGGDHHLVEHWAFDVACRRLYRSSLSSFSGADKIPIVHLSAVEANPWTPAVRLLPAEMTPAPPPSADGLCSADIEILLQRDFIVVYVVSCDHLAP